MQLVIQVGFPNGQVTATVDDFTQATAVHDWLVEQGLLKGVDRPAGTARNSAVVDVESHDVTQQANLDLQREAHEASLVAQAAANAQAEAAAEAAAKTIAKKAAAAAKKAAEKPVDDKPAVSVADVTKAVTDYAAKFGPTEARALFARFGVSRGGDLKPEQFLEFIDLARDYIARNIKASDAVMPEGSEELM